MLDPARKATIINRSPGKAMDKGNEQPTLSFLLGLIKASIEI